MNKTLKCLLLLIPIFLFSCKKEDLWSKKAEVEMVTQNIDNSAFQLNQANFQVISADLMIDEIILSGKRLQSKDYFEKLEKKQEINFFSSNLLSITFQIPQGNYEFIEMDILSVEQDNFILKLLYEHPGQGQGNPNNNSYYLDIKLDISEIPSISAVTENGESIHLVEADKNYELTMRIDPEILFDNISLGMFNAMVNTSQNNSIEISDKINVNLQQKISNNISSAIGLVLSEK